MSQFTFKSTMYHLTTVKDQKKDHLFEVLAELRKQGKSERPSKIIILTQSHLTADYISCLLNLKANISTTSIHDFKSQAENDKATITFNRGSIAVIVTNKTDIKFTLTSVKHIINFDMFFPNVLFFENQSLDIFRKR